MVPALGTALGSCRIASLPLQGGPRAHHGASNPFHATSPLPTAPSRQRAPAMGWIGPPGCTAGAHPRVIHSSAPRTGTCRASSGRSGGSPAARVRQLLVSLGVVCVPPPCTGSEQPKPIAQQASQTGLLPRGSTGSSQAELSRTCHTRTGKLRDGVNRQPRTSLLCAMPAARSAFSRVAGATLTRPLPTADDPLHVL